MSGDGYRVLLADDDPLSREFLSDALESFGCRVAAVDDGCAATKALAKQDFDLVVTDLRMPRKDGLQVLRELRESGSRTPVVLVTAYGTVEVAVQALRDGADDVLVKPVELDQIELVLARLGRRDLLVAENEYLRSSVPEPAPAVAESAAMKAVLALVEKVARSPATVLVTGESGTGKEIIASEIHRRSGRATRALVKVNCAAIPATLIESEFFGHEAGAFTGATGRKIGKFELADGGTLLLDEIGELAVDLQSKLLRVLEDGAVHRVGGTEPIRVDVRLIAATNQDLKRAVAEGRFREDLYYRLNIVPIELRPLRERPEDVLPLARQFLAQDARESGQRTPTLTEDACEALLGHDWPGNVRELRNLMQRAALLTTSDRIGLEEITPWLDPAGPTLIPRPDSGVDDPVERLVGSRLRDVEDALILSTLERCGGNRTRAASTLGVSPRTLYNRLQRLGPRAR